MKKVLLFSHDPGGANVIIPLVRPLRERGYEVELWGKGPSLKKYQNTGLESKDMMSVVQSANAEAVEAFIAARSPDVVITATSAEDFTEKYIWKAARNLGISSFAILDQWLNYGVRFSAFPCSRAAESLKARKYDYLPSRILLMDELARQDALKEGLPLERLRITGQPHFEALMKKERLDKKKIVSIRDSLGVAQDGLLVVFASEPITETYGANPDFGYTELTILENLIPGLQEISTQTQHEIVLVIRAHPREKKEKFDLMERLSSDRLKIVSSNDCAAEELIDAAHLVCGMSSMFLLESVLLGQAIVSMQIGLKGQSLFVLDRNNVVTSAKSREELNHMLYEALVEKKKDREPRMYFKTNAVENILEQVHKDIGVST